ncbi:MAG TPA: UDP-3-O-(3-hydroxymyristoyl)glucosamine N-acyltransferase [Holosporales bacterium]|nr:UDP-3-O-(3-hydroxymyristoyl)glucosamine N-acyltransferase [Holosporales bacterium]
MHNQFIKKNKDVSLQQILSLLNVAVNNDVNKTLILTGIAPLNTALQEHISFLHNAKYVNDLENTKAGVVIVHPDFKDKVPNSTLAIESQEPYRDFGKVMNLFYPKPQSTGVISNKADVHQTAVIGRNVQIDAFASIKAGVKIGDNTIIKSHTTLGENVEIGDHSYVEENVTLSHCIIGRFANIKTGARVGQAGFGFHMDAKGHFDIQQLGCVRIGDDVQIGSNTTIDRGSQSDTIIGNHVRIDNQVQIAHNVEIGDASVIVAQVGIAGSTKLGKFVIVAGQVGIAGHLKIGNFVKVAGGSGIMRDIEDGATVAGRPAVNVKDWHRQTVALKKLGQKKQEIKGC